MGTLAPIAAASGSGIRCTRLAPAAMPASITARCSTVVTPVGTATITSGRKRRCRPRRALDEVAQHGRGDQVVGDHAVLQRAHDAQAAGRAPHHLASRVPDGLDAAVLHRNGDHRRLVDDHTLADEVDQHVGGAEVDPKPLRAQGSEHLANRRRGRRARAALNRDIGAKLLQVAGEVLVAALDDLRVIEHRRPVRHQPRQQQGRAGADVGP